MRKQFLRLAVLFLLPLTATICVGASASGGHPAVAGIMPPVELPIAAR
jgi:hypothetical protein